MIENRVFFRKKVILAIKALFGFEHANVFLSKVADRNSTHSTMPPGVAGQPSE